MQSPRAAQRAQAGSEQAGGPEPGRGARSESDNLRIIQSCPITEAHDSRYRSKDFLLDLFTISYQNPFEINKEVLFGVLGFGL